MNAEIKKLWLEALRSGEYQQGRGSLRSGYEYCCLGVLCDLHRKAVGGSWTSDYSDEYGGYDYEYEDEHEVAVLPGCVMKWAGLHKCSPKDDSWSLDELNDGGVPFSEIADLIEAFL